MRRFGIIGYPLSHSFSQKHFNDKFVREKLRSCVYETFPIRDLAEFPGLLLKYPDLCGLSVTIPYKERVIPFLDRLDDTALKIGAVNCISFKEGKTTGHNTDAAGFRASLEAFAGKEVVRSALVLGTGGAAKAVAHVLGLMGITFRFVSRNKQSGMLSYRELGREIVLENRLVVNCTPAGMFPDVNGAPAIPYEFLTQEHLLFDLIYNPEETVFLRRGREKGCQVRNGLEMLRLQAEEAWKKWNA